MRIKSFLIAILFCAINFVMNAQSADVRFGDNDWRRSYTKSHTADTISGVTEVSKTFFINKSYDYNYQVQVKADSLNQDGTSLIVLYGSVDGTTTYALDTITWYMSTADTTVLFESSSSVRWPFLIPALKGNSSSDKGRLDDIFINISSPGQ